MGLTEGTATAQTRIKGNNRSKSGVGGVRSLLAVRLKAQSFA